MIQKIALIVAGGKGERMNTYIPKQFIEINAKAVLMYTIEAFVKYDADIQIILVLPASQTNQWENLCKKYAFNIKHSVVTGGPTRFHSVQNGLKSVVTPSVVAVHDGVRPLVSVETISKCFVEAGKHKSAVPVTEMVESIRKITGSLSVSANRSEFRLVQTPQVFDGELLKRAYQQDYSDSFTDDASVVESLGEKIYLVEGNRENIKITTPMDLVIAKTLLTDLK